MYGCFVGRRSRHRIETKPVGNKKSIMVENAPCVVDNKEAAYIMDKKKTCNGLMCSSVVICNWTGQESVALYKGS